VIREVDSDGKERIVELFRYKFHFDAMERGAFVKAIPAAGSCLGVAMAGGIAGVGMRRALRVRWCMSKRRPENGQAR
jgi:hypothetical protein